jgi:pilus assembly protein Flp/PilA
MKGDIVMLFAPKEKGQGLVEYALIIVLIAIVVIVAMQFLAPTIGNVFTQIGNTLQGV